MDLFPTYLSKLFLFFSAAIIRMNIFLIFTYSCRSFQPLPKPSALLVGRLCSKDASQKHRGLPMLAPQTEHWNAGL
jgi:hypothetical protein